MIRFYFKKLVRDNVVPNCLNDPEVATTQFRVMDGNEYFRALIQKVTEEANEIPIDSREEALHELADVQSVVDALRDYFGFSKQELRDAVMKKAEAKGEFKKHHYMEFVDLEDDSAWVEVFRKQPHKYIEEQLQPETAGQE